MTSTNVKQVIVVRTDLNMRKGKMIAQGAHASMAAALDGRLLGFSWRGKRAGELEFSLYNDPARPGSPTVVVNDVSEELMSWLSGKFTKIVVGAGSEEEIVSLRDRARDIGLPNALITDAGDTEFHGRHTITALAVGPAASTDVDEVTGHLKLL